MRQYFFMKKFRTVYQFCRMQYIWKLFIIKSKYIITEKGLWIPWVKNLYPKIYKLLV